MRLADGWMPFGLASEQIATMLAEAEVPDGFEVILSTGSAVDPGRDAERVRRLLRGLGDAGATAVTCSVHARSVEHYREQLKRLRDVAAEIEEKR